MCKEKIKFSIMVVVISVLLSLYLGAVYATDEQPEQITDTENITPIKPTTTPTKELVVFSFYDTQLQVMCYMSHNAIDCILRDSMSDKARMFIDDRIMKHREKLPTRVLPRIVPLDK